MERKFAAEKEVPVKGIKDVTKAEREKNVTEAEPVVNEMKKEKKNSR